MREHLMRIEMNRRRLSVVFCVFAFVAIHDAPAQAAESRPNIVFIFSDDHAYQAVSAYGFGLNKTTNIDRIGAEGMRVERCLVTNSLCGPGRASVLTGKYS